MLIEMLMMVNYDSVVDNAVVDDGDHHEDDVCDDVMMMMMMMMVLIKREIILYLPIPFSIDADMMMMS